MVEILSNIILLYESGVVFYDFINYFEAFLQIR